MQRDVGIVSGAPPSILGRRKALILPLWEDSSRKGTYEISITNPPKFGMVVEVAINLP